jgi:SAM-dependent methyltransferase
MSADCSDIRTELESWYTQATGGYLLNSLRQTTAELLSTAFGYHILQLGACRGLPLFDDCTINHRVYCSEQGGDGVDLLARSQELPLDSDSVDVVIAHHCLEFASNPHQVLREIQRVLTPQGHLLVVGINPASLLGVSNQLRGLSSRSMWYSHQAISERRLIDWLGLLGCEVQARSHLYAVPPIGSGRLREWLTRCDSWASERNLPLGGLYVVHAIKQVSALHRPGRIRPRRERLIGLATPAAASCAGAASREGDAAA